MASFTSIQSKINYEVNEKGNRVLVIEGLSGQAVVPSGTDISFYNCHISKLSCEGSSVIAVHDGLLGDVINTNNSTIICKSTKGYIASGQKLIVYGYIKECTNTTFEFYNVQFERRIHDITDCLVTINDCQFFNTSGTILPRTILAGRKIRLGHLQIGGDHIPKLARTLCLLVSVEALSIIRN